jgi:peptidoglycan/LPS O-acetylase OafA/YrhL
LANKNVVTRRPSPWSSEYLPTLDGWRAIAIVSVLLFHDRSHTLGPLSTSWFYQYGYLGVDVFFAISGLLICTRLLNEEQSKGKINLRNFYIRRAFRILPSAIFFLLTLLILSRTIHLQVGLVEILASLFCVQNYSSIYRRFLTLAPFYTSHFWSLTVEEHFYFMLPALLVFVPRKWRIQSLLTLAIMIGLHRIRPESWHSFRTDIRVDALIIPAIIAILIRAPDVRDQLTRWVRFWPIVVLIIVILNTFESSSRATGLLVAWLMPFLILGTMLRPQSLFSRFLESTPMRYVGRLSYSLYLWQQLFVVAHFIAYPSPIAKLQTWPLNIVMAVACALFSHYVIERPFIRLGHYLAPKVATNTIARSEVSMVIETDLTSDR